MLERGEEGVKEEHGSFRLTSNGQIIICRGDSIMSAVDLCFPKTIVLTAEAGRSLWEDR